MTVRAALGGVVGAVVAAAVRAVARAAAPDRAALRVPGLSRGTTVVFDRRGVPHVRASSEADAFRALGACHGLDRAFGMDVLRRLLRGRLSEWTGERRLRGRGPSPLAGLHATTVDADRVLRSLDLLRAARATLEAATRDERALLDAYVEGVAAAWRGRRPIEHRLLGADLEPWTALDSCLVGKGMVLGLSMGWRLKPALAAVAQALADRPAHLAAILPRGPRPQDGSVTTPRASDGAPGSLPFDVGACGSNAFVVGAGRSASGAPLLANDPHLDVALPPIWYLASVVGGAYAAVGATLPGAPGVIVGRTPTVAWGLTNAMLDDGDLWREEVDAEGLRYRVDGVWRDLEVEPQSIGCRGAPPVPFVLRRTHRGPIVSDAFVGHSGPPLSLRATFHETTRDLQPFLALGRARTAEDVERAARGFGSPAQNLVWATARGEAGYRLMGRVVRRPPGGTVLPRDGTTTASDWGDDVPPEELPALRLSPDAVCVTANDPIAGPEYPHYLSRFYEPSHRARRLRTLLAGRRDLRASDLAAMQRDLHDGALVAFREEVVRPLAPAARAKRPAASALLDVLLRAPDRAAADARGLALAHFTVHRLARRVFGRLGPACIDRWLACLNAVEEPLLCALRDPENPWVAPAERPAALADAAIEAAADLAARGLPPDAAWGEAHVLTLRHPLGASRWLSAAFDRGPWPMPGSGTTVDCGHYLRHRPAEVVAAASYRQVVDLGDPEGSARMVTFGGQSGNPGSRRYDDLTPLWRSGRSLPMRLEGLPERGRRLSLVP